MAGAVLEAPPRPPTEEDVLPAAAPVEVLAVPAGGASAAAAAAANVVATGLLPELIGRHMACIYRPMQFFVAWNGVLTLAYTGIPPAMEQLKQELAAAAPGLRPEFPGSLWPKTTLAAVRDGAVLSLRHLEVLHAICEEERPGLEALEPVTVRHLSVVLYYSCCLDTLLAAARVPLRLPPDSRPPSGPQAAAVRAVMDEFSAARLADYHRQVAREGHRSSHYREPKPGATLVHFLGDSAPAATLAKFCARVEAVLPGVFDWFPLESLHITVRGLT